MSPLPDDNMRSRYTPLYFHSASGLLGTNCLQCDGNKPCRRCATRLETWDCIFETKNTTCGDSKGSTHRTASESHVSPVTDPKGRSYWKPTVNSFQFPVSEGIDDKSIQRQNSESDIQNVCDAEPSLATPGSSGILATLSETAKSNAAAHSAQGSSESTIECMMDIRKVSKLAYNVGVSCRGACGGHVMLSSDIESLQEVLRRLEDESTRPESLLNRQNSSRKEGLKTSLEHCRKVLSVLHDIFEKYNTVSVDKPLPQLWNYIQFGKRKIQSPSEFRVKISTYTFAITLQLNLISAGSQGRAEREIGDALPEVRESLSWIIAKLRGYEGSTLDSDCTDDQPIWKKLRKELIEEGFPSPLIQKHRNMIIHYIIELRDRGLLDGLEALNELLESNEEPHQPEISPPTNCDPPVSKRTRVRADQTALHTNQSEGLDRDMSSSTSSDYHSSESEQSGSEDTSDELLSRLADAHVDEEQFVTPMLDPARQAMVDRVMAEFWVIFNQLWPSDIRQHPGDSHPEPGQLGRLTTNQHSAQSQQFQRKRQREDDGEDFDRGSDRSHQPPSQSTPPANGPTERPKFACMFRKHDPCRYSIYSHRSCALSHWPSIARVKYCTHHRRSLSY